MAKDALRYIPHRASSPSTHCATGRFPQRLLCATQAAVPALVHEVSDHKRCEIATAGRSRLPPSPVQVLRLSFQHGQLPVLTLFLRPLDPLALGPLGQPLGFLSVVPLDLLLHVSTKIQWRLAGMLGTKSPFRGPRKNHSGNGAIANAPGTNPDPNRGGKNSEGAHAPAMTSTSPLSIPRMRLPKTNTAFYAGGAAG